MPRIEKVYHIYAGNKCIMHNLKEEDFKTNWQTINTIVGFMKTDYELDDLSYEEVTINREDIEPSY